MVKALVFAEHQLKRLLKKKNFRYDENDIPIKILKQNGDIFGGCTCAIFEKCVDTSTLSDILKR